MFMFSANCDSTVKSIIIILYFQPIDHPNVKLFITHGGLHSVEESTYNAVPMIGIPFFADQFTNIKMIERKGFGKLIEVHDITENTLQTTIDELLTNQM